MKETLMTIIKKKFTAVGARGSVNSFFTKGNVDYHIIGAEFSYNKEFGDFSVFRKTLRDEPYYDTLHNTQLYTAGLTSEVILHSRKKTSRQLGARLFIWQSFNNMTYFNPESDEGYPKKPKNKHYTTFIFRSAETISYHYRSRPRRQSSQVRIPVLNLYSKLNQQT